MIFSFNNINLTKSIIMNIMISGASGLVGRDLIRPLLKENHKIIAIYRSQNKARKNISHKNLIWKKVDLKHLSIILFVAY